MLRVCALPHAPVCIRSRKRALALPRLHGAPSEHVRSLDSSQKMLNEGRIHAQDRGVNAQSNRPAWPLPWSQRPWRGCCRQLHQETRGWSGGRRCPRRAPGVRPCRSSESHRCVQVMVPVHRMCLQVIYSLCRESSDNMPVRCVECPIMGLWAGTGVSRSYTPAPPPRKAQMQKQEHNMSCTYIPHFSGWADRITLTLLLPYVFHFFALLRPHLWDLKTQPEWSFRSRRPVLRSISPCAPINPQLSVQLVLFLFAGKTAVKEH